MSRKLDLDKGFSKTHAVKRTAFDKFAAAEKVIGAPDGDQPVDAQANKPHAVALPSAAAGNDLSTALGTVVEADFKDSFSHEYRAWCARHGYKPGSVTTLSLSAVKQSPFNPRHFYRKNSISALALNLSSQGQQDPIHVSPDYEKDGEFFLNDGGRRVRSLREIQAKDVKAIIDDVPQGIKSYKLGHDLNTQHETQTVFDDAIVWKRLLDQKHFESQVALAEELSIDQSMVTMTLSICELPMALIEEMVDNGQRFGANMAYAVVRHFRSKGEKPTSSLIRRILSEELSVRKVNELVRKAAETSNKGPQRSRYAERVEVKFFDDVHVGDLRTYGEDRLALNLRGLPRDVRDRVQERIVAILAEEGRSKDTLV